MDSRIIAVSLTLAFVSGLAGCSPGSGGYAEWSDYRQHQANDDAYLSQRNADAAQWQARSGDYQGAQLSQSAADAEAAKAQQEQAHATRDQWFSQF